LEIAVEQNNYTGALAMSRSSSISSVHAGSSKRIAVRERHQQLLHPSGRRQAKYVSSGHGIYSVFQYCTIFALLLSLNSHLKARAFQRL
jgi:hypothetical protein